jgi:cytochrome c-type biogenesis protein CcmH
VGITATLVAMPIWRGTFTLGRVDRRYALAGAFVATFAAAALIIYFAIGSRHSLASHPEAMASPAPGPAGAPASTPASGKTMEAEVAALEARLSRDGGSADDWNLLAKAYEFLGRPDDARRARAHLASPTAGAAPPMSAGALMAAAAATEPQPNPAAPAVAAPASLEDLKKRVTANPRDAQAWLSLADLYRGQHDNSDAREALAKVVALHGMTAQSWADYADVLASLAGGSLTGAAAPAIDSALAMDPANLKGLWLKASQAHEQHHYGDAITWWRKLRTALPAGSPDASIIDGNIAEDSSLAGLAPPAAPASAAAPAAAAGAAEVSGTVSIDSRFADRVQRDATLFIYAKAADSPGPPLAVLRTTAAAWPVNFRLDDSMAMIPSRRLSQFDKVVIEARISRSGQATPSSGDLYVTSPVLHPDSSKKLALVINREIG